MSWVKILSFVTKKKMFSIKTFDSILILSNIYAIYINQAQRHLYCLKCMRFYNTNVSKKEKSRGIPSSPIVPYANSRVERGVFFFFYIQLADFTPLMDV